MTERAAAKSRRDIGRMALADTLRPGEMRGEGNGVWANMFLREQRNK